VKVLGVRSTSKASVVVEVNGQKRLFRDGEGIQFPRRMGGRQTIESDKIEFVGYGLQIPSVDLDDYASVDPAGKVVVFMGQGPKDLPPNSYRLLTARSRNAMAKRAVATIGPQSAGFGGRPGGTVPPADRDSSRSPASPPQGGRPASAVDNGDFTTVERYDRRSRPQTTSSTSCSAAPISRIPSSKRRWRDRSPSLRSRSKG